MGSVNPLKSLLCILVAMATMNVRVSWCGGSHICTHDVDCEWFDAHADWYEDAFGEKIYEKPDGTECCSDNKCHENCHWETVWFVLLVIVLPTICCIGCAVAIGVAIYCAIKQGKRNDNQPSGGFIAGGPPHVTYAPAPVPPSYTSAHPGFVNPAAAPPTTSPPLYPTGSSYPTADPAVYPPPVGEKSGAGEANFGYMAQGDI